MAHIDLDAKRRQRKAKKAPTFAFEGKTYTLPKELPYRIFKDIEKMEKDPSSSVTSLDLLLETVLGNRLGEFQASNPSVEDVMDLLGSLPDLYEIEVKTKEKTVQKPTPPR